MVHNEAVDKIIGLKKKYADFAINGMKTTIIDERNFYGYETYSINIT